MHTYARDTWLGLTIWTRDDTELRVVVVAYKCTLALNTTLKVLSCGVLMKQTPPNTDSHSIVLWKRYAMVRWGTTRLTIDFLTIIQADALMLTLEAKPPVLVELEHTLHVARQVLFTRIDISGKAFSTASIVFTFGFTGTALLVSMTSLPSITPGSRCASSIP